MSKVVYLKGHGLRIVPVYERNTPVEFQVVNSKEEVVAHSGMLYRMEHFIMGGRKIETGPLVDAVAEIPTL